MTREEFDNLKVGDKIIHAFGGIGVVTEKKRMAIQSGIKVLTVAMAAAKFRLLGTKAK